MVSSDAVEVRNFPTFSYIAVIFKSLFFVAHKYQAITQMTLINLFTDPGRLGTCSLLWEDFSKHLTFENSLAWVMR